jgi:hypothetical protein
VLQDTSRKAFDKRRQVRLRVHGLITREKPCLHRVSSVFRVPEHASLPRAVLCQRASAWGRSSRMCTYGRERARRGPLNQTSNRGACRANEIHRSTQLTNCPAAFPFTSALLLFLPVIPCIVVSLIPNHVGGSQAKFCRISLRALPTPTFSAPIASCWAQKNVTTTGWHWCLLVNSDSHRRTFPVALFRGGYGKRLKLVLSAYTFVTCFTARSFFSPVNVKCALNVLSQCNCKVLDEKSG